jgi:5-(carboxyamino)imidazole ribonucleotide synthase
VSTSVAARPPWWDRPDHRPVVGVVGGGQLARMMQPAAIALDLELRLLSASAGDSAALVVPGTTVGDERGRDDLLAFGSGVDVLTFDHEHVPGEHLRALEEAGVVVRPGSAALAHAQDKATMRRDLAAAGLPVPRFAVLDDARDLTAAAQEVGGGALVLKTARGGYDGRGVWVLDGPEGDMSAFLAGVPVVVEERVPFVRELSALVARSPSGQAVAYPVVESVQREGICVEVVAPAPGLSESVALAAQRLALQVATRLGVVGVLAVELFELPDGGLLVNELAMRPHNTGHWSIDGALTSQFENHLRAVLDLPLGSPRALASLTVMVNVLGGDLPDVHRALRHVLARDPGLRVHLYGKQVRPGRKIGHVTVLGEDLDDLRQRAWHAADYISGVIDE